MNKLYYGYTKAKPPVGYIMALKCEDRFYVITKQAYEKVKTKLHSEHPLFYTDLPVFIDGINI